MSVETGDVGLVFTEFDRVDARTLCSGASNISSHFLNLAKRETDRL